MRDIARLGTAIRDVGAQVIVPTVSNGQVLVARARGNESDTVLVEGASPALFDIIGAEFAAGRPFTELEDREGAHVAVVGANLAKALFGSASPLGQTLTLAGDSYVVVGELAKRRGGFFGENRQDNVLNLPAGTVRNRFGEPERVVLYMRAKPGQRAACFAQAEAILRLLRKLPPTAENDFTLSTADQIIATFDGLSARIGLVTVGLRRAGRVVSHAREAGSARPASPGRAILAAAQAAAARQRLHLSTADQIIATFDGLSARIGLATVGLAGVSLLIGAIGIANVMFISVTERTREIGLRLAVGARRQEVLVQFLMEAAFLSAIGGVAGVAAALGIGLLLTLVISGFSAVAPLWAIIAGLAASLGVGIVAGYWPALRAAGLDPVEALRHE